MLSSLEGNPNIHSHFRHSSCNIRIKLQTVSRQHTKIENDNGTIYISPLTTNGPTYLNDEVITEPVELYHGDVITIGGRTFRYEKDDLTNATTITGKQSLGSEKDVLTTEISKKLFEHSTSLSLGNLDSSNHTSSSGLFKTPLSDITSSVDNEIRRYSAIDRLKTPPKEGDSELQPSSCLKRKSVGGGRKSISFAAKIERVCTFEKHGKTTEIKRDVSPKTPEHLLALKKNEIVLLEKIDDLLPGELIKPERISDPSDKFILEAYKGDVTLANGFIIEPYQHEMTLQGGFILEPYKGEVTMALQKDMFPAQQEIKRKSQSPVSESSVNSNVHMEEKRVSFTLVAPTPVSMDTIVQIEVPIVEKILGNRVSPKVKKSPKNVLPEFTVTEVEIISSTPTRIKSRVEYWKKKNQEEKTPTSGSEVEEMNIISTHKPRRDRKNRAKVEEPISQPKSTRSRSKKL
jgi:hypothetical protein